MRRVAGLLMFGGCATAQIDATPSQRAVVEVLAVRHEVDCARVATVTPDPVADLAWVAENWPDPGWIGIRAAECLGVVADRPTYDAIAARWTANPDWLGLAEVVADRSAP